MTDTGQGLALKGADEAGDAQEDNTIKDEGDNNEMNTGTCPDPAPSRLACMRTMA